MTERKPRRRASKRALRAWAWTAGGLAFVAPFTALGASPTPPSDQAQASRERRPVLVVRKITRVVVVRERPAEAPVQVVYAPSGSSSSASTGTVAAPASNPAPAPPPPPAPTTSTGGS